MKFLTHMRIGPRPAADLAEAIAVDGVAMGVCLDLLRAGMPASPVAGP
ncbi:hypothetical protein [Pelomonas cellulosilytica]|uniref:Uncharacterized protein n=1 Tax=Pelomonas cellulosilytica TaxID=2906762 RepID=A0ABS8XW83_9BURK|nr:hypothetical protein [Pelomonas sp. P8]MCE4556907.1 hypothetical protein [Pelomonas sp. P8]